MIGIQVDEMRSTIRLEPLDDRWWGVIIELVRPDGGTTRLRVEPDGVIHTNASHRQVRTTEPA